MEFYKWDRFWTSLKKIRPDIKDKSLAFRTAREICDKKNDEVMFNRTVIEGAWERIDRPYYNLWPAIIPMLLKINLNIPTIHLDNLAIQPLEIKLPKISSTPGVFSIKSILMGYGPIKIGKQLEKGLRVLYDDGSLNIAHFSVVLDTEFTVQEACDALKNDVAATALRLCTCIALINNNPDIIAPDILVSDKDKWVNASEEERLRLIEKARERGKNGWNVGAGIEHIPHYRRPHPALVRVGKGRTLTRIVMRKGSVVHRGKITEVPSGYESDSD